MQSKHGATLHSQTRETILNIIKVCEEEAQNNTFKLPLCSKTERAALYAGVSVRTIRRIKIEDEKRNREDKTKLLSSPGKKRYRPSVVCNDEIDFPTIRRIIEKFYLEYKVVPTTRKLLVKLKEEINFPYEKESLRTLLKANGFYWRKCQNKRKLLLEKPNILHLRYKYLRSIKKYRQENRNIVYLDETWVDNDLTFKKCWQSKEVFGVISNISSTGRLIIVHAGSENGFVPNASLIFKAGQASGDYHGQMNYENFTKWLNEKLFPNIPLQSVIVFDNAPYHSVLEDKIPTKSSLKRSIIEWLTKKEIPHDPSSRKIELYEIVCRHKPQDGEKNYKVDTLIRNNGHIPLRTPPYMCEFNPIELAWAQVKYYIRNRNTTGEFTLKKLLELSNEAILSVGPDVWKKCIRHVVDIEDKYWEQDHVMEEITERMIINLGDDTDSDSSSVSDIDTDFNMSVEDN